MKSIRNAIVVSDLHCGCKYGLCPPGEIPLDDGGFYLHSDKQSEVWRAWTEFWCKWVPMVTNGEPYCVIVNGDSLDGVHHRSVHQISHNLADQSRIAEMVLRPIVEQCEGRFYMIRGTEAHVGPSGQEEERLARVLGAIPNKEGQRARYDMWLKLDRALVHFAHHIGTTGSMAYETSALMKEIEQMLVHAARWNAEPPDVIVRSHRHVHGEVRPIGHKGYITCVVTPGWQMKTPFAFRVPGARRSEPHVGGIMIRCGSEDIYTRAQYWPLDRDEAETATMEVENA